MRALWTKTNVIQMEGFFPFQYLCMESNLPDPRPHVHHDAHLGHAVVFCDSKVQKATEVCDLDVM